MTKITGNESYHVHDNSAVNTGIPIRLYIAAMILALHNSRHSWDGAAECQYSLELTDQLIATYNNTPNPNE